MGAVNTEIPKMRLGFAHEGSVTRTQSPRPDLVRLLDQYASDVVSIVFEYDERKLEPNEVLFEPRVQIQLRFPTGEPTPGRLPGVSIHRFQLGQILDAKTWVDKNAADPFGVPYDERINHQIVEPLMDRVESVFKEGFKTMAA